MGCCGGSTSGGCTCTERAQVGAGGARVEIYTPATGKRAVAHSVRATNQNGEDVAFSIAVIDAGASMAAIADADWIVRDQPLLNGETVRAIAALTLGPGQRVIGEADAPGVTFSVSKLERTA